jgi:HD-GYP domain-containing protein (c-di-GMP phosphodiesterase class II)
MKELSITEIPVDCALEEYLCHTSGEILHSPGEIFSKNHLALLHTCEIEKVLVIPASEDTAALKKSLRRRNVAIEFIPEGEPVATTLFDENGTLVIKAGTLFTPTVQHELRNRGITVLEYERDPMALQLLQYSRYQLLCKSDLADSIGIIDGPDTASKKAGTEPAASEADDKQNMVPIEPVPEDRFIQAPSKHVSTALCKQLMQQPLMLSVTIPDGTPLISVNKTIIDRNSAATIAFKSRYWKWVSQTDAIFDKLKSNRETAFEECDEVVLDIIDAYCSDSRYCLNLMNLRHPPVSEKYLATHAVNVAIAAIGVGVETGYPSALVHECAIGALLHDIGHLVTYRPLLAKQKLDSSEQHKYDHHAVVGVAMLKNTDRIPLSTMMVIAQHHEHPDCSGSIFHARADQIHDFARLVGVIDSFETGCRFTGAVAALSATAKNAQDGKYDMAFCRKLLALLSSFPIGVSVRIADGTICKVIGVDPDSFRMPILRSVFTMHDDHLYPIDKQEIVDTGISGFSIVEEVVHSALKADIAAGFKAP